MIVIQDSNFLAEPLLRSRCAVLITTIERCGSDQVQRHLERPFEPKQISESPIYSQKSVEVFSRL